MNVNILVQLLFVLVIAIIIVNLAGQAKKSAASPALLVEAPPAQNVNQNVNFIIITPQLKKSATTLSSTPRPERENFCWHLCSSVKT